MRPRRKEPRAGSHGYLDATCDPGHIDRHWYYHPHDNIGVRPPRGTVVLDIDPRNGGEKSIRALTDRHGQLLKTWAAQTGSGGWHYWFTVGDMALRAHLGAGIDVKHGGNGFVVAPPSVHPCGGVYVWRNPPIGQPAPAPEWLRRALAPPPPPVRAAPPGTRSGCGNGPYSLAALLGRIHLAPQGQRNRTLYGAARDAAKQGDLDAFADLLAAVAVERGLSPTEAEATIRSARKAS
ncbi:hypothetical protein A5703_03010 [Mycobacterium sp. E188]|nr:hypothetical protein A5703_03010 [Mycobacterium sp. E188]OBH37263.1 hypothetical protein A5691_26910 [Mycobacterium sp. E183]